MNLSELQTLIGDLTNDPVHDRYTLPQINTELDNSQNKWNVEAKIIKRIVPLTLSAGVREYPILVSPAGIQRTIIAFSRVTVNGLELKKRDKSWFDLYSGTDWTLETGTPTDYYVDITSSSDVAEAFLVVRPVPTAADVAFAFVTETIVAHTPMSAATDEPFTEGIYTSDLLRPYDWGLAYDVAARLLARDPSAQNTLKAVGYSKIANGIQADVVQVFKALQREEPMRVRGGKYFNSGNVRNR